MSPTTQKLWKKIKGFDHIIWDWNGTLLNDVKIVVDVLTLLMNKHNMSPPSVDEYKDIFGFPVIDYYKRLGFDMETHSFDDISEHFHTQYEDRVKEASLFEGVVETLSLIGQNQKTQSLLSASSQWHLDTIVNAFNLDIHFDFIYGLDHQLADSKIERGRELVNASKIPSHKTILIGDTDHDYEVAKELGIHSLLIADGHQSFSRLEEVHDNVLKTRF